MNNETPVGVCIGCITANDWIRKPLSSIIGKHREEPLGFCDIHAD